MNCIITIFLIKSSWRKENVAATVLLLLPVNKRTLQNVLPNVTYSPSRRQAGAPTINIQSTLRTAPICVNMFHCTVIW